MSYMMANVVLESLKEEVQVLLRAGLNAFYKAVEKKTVSSLNNDAFLDQAIEILRGEDIKLERLETVIAVVGTMKAGKSTTINAIVGREILPNRNAPMTAIPTLIKHCKGQKQPRLIFTDKASKPVNQLIRKLRKAFKDKNNQPKLEQLQLDNDLYATVEKIRDGMKVVNQALGEQLIFDFLISINDLVRIAPIFDLVFPFDQYQEVDQLPVIEVEFAHLKNTENHGGNLILLDTPGPNEAGQTHLRPMLQNQLKKASAVLVVMDYTQLKSEADAQIREDLEGITNTVKNRIYALVNKFDNCDRNGMQVNEAKTFVESLTNGLIRKENIYPVAAKIGYLANQARYACLEDGSLPEVNDVAWIEDFYQEAGLRRETYRTPERIAESIDDLWEASRLSEPLKDVIEVSHKKAAFIALDSAMEKLADCLTHLDEGTVQFFDQQLQVDIPLLEKSIQALKRRLANMSEA